MADSILVQLHDCQQLVREFFPLLSVASMQLYISVPPFLPKNTQLLQEEDHHSVKILYHGDRAQNWNACVWTLEGHTTQIHAAVFSPDNNAIVSVSANQTVEFWDRSNGSHVYTLQAHSGPISCVAYSSDGTYFLTGSHDHTIKMWNTVTKEILYTMKGHKEFVTCVAFSPDGKHIVSGS